MQNQRTKTRAPHQAVLRGRPEVWTDDNCAAAPIQANILGSTWCPGSRTPSEVWAAIHPKHLVQAINYPSRDRQLRASRKDAWEMRMASPEFHGDFDAVGEENGDVRRYCFQDFIFSTVAVIDPERNVVERCDYEPYGRVNIWTDDYSDTRAATAVHLDFLFTGQRYDPETGLYHYKARALHPTLGRFLQRDQLNYADGLSLYTYSRDRPTTVSDSLGEQATTQGVKPRPAETTPVEGASCQLFDWGHLWFAGVEVWAYNTDAEVGRACNTAARGCARHVVEAVDYAVDQRDGRYCVVVQSVTWAIRVHILKKGAWGWGPDWRKDPMFPVYYQRALAFKLTNAEWHRGRKEDGQVIVRGPRNYDSGLVHEMVHVAQLKANAAAAIDERVRALNARGESCYRCEVHFRTFD